MKKAVISIDHKGERVYVSKIVVLGAPTVCETVSLEKATLFSNPDAIQDTLDKFNFNKPQIEVVEVEINVTNVITSNTEKYGLFLELSEILAKEEKWLKSHTLI